MSQQDITADFVATTFTATKSAIAKTQFISQLAEIEQRHPNLINEQIIDAVIDFVLKEQLKDRQAMDPIPTVNELGVVFGMRRDLAEATLNKVPQLILSIKAKVRWNPPLLLPYALLHAAVSADSSLANREVVKLLLEGPPEGAAAIKSWSESVKLLIVQRSDLFTDEDLVAIAKLTAVFSDSRSESQKAKSPIFTMILEGRPDLAAALWKSILPEYIRYPDGYSWAAQEIIKKHPDVISTEELHQILDTRKGNNRPPYSLLPTITEHASGVFDEAVAVKLAGLLLQYPDSNYQETRHMDELLAKRPEFGAAVFAEIEQKFDLNNIGEDFALKRAGLHLFESVLQHAPTAITVEFVKNLAGLVMDYRGSHQWSYHGDYRNQYFGDLLLKDILTQRPDLIDPAYEILTEPSAFRRKTKAEQTRIMRAGSFEHFDVLLEVATLKPELAKAVLGLIQKCHTRSLRNLRRYLHVAKLAVIDPKLLRVATSILSTAELKDGYDGESIYLAYKHMLNAQPSFGDADYIQNAVRKAATTKDDYL
ncbi:MAG: hypothetical protein WAO98_08475 [Alphaproteobacteria bacterium]